MKIFVVFLFIFSLFGKETSLSVQDSSAICDEIIMQRNSMACSSKFVMTTSASSYTIDEPVYIVIRSTIPDITIMSVHLSVQDERNINVGSWTTRNGLIESTSCGSLIQNSKNENNDVDAIWKGSSDVVGRVIIKMTVIENNGAIYVDCYNLSLNPSVFDNSFVSDEQVLESNQTTITTTTRPITTTVTSSPTAEVTVNVTWTFNSKSNVTTVSMTIHNLKSAQWAAIGLGIEQAMGEAHVFMCKRLTNDTIAIDRYINPDDHDHPESAGSEQGGVMTRGEQQFRDGVVICHFTLSNFTMQSFEQLKSIERLSQSTKYYPLFAAGSLHDNGEPHKHGKDSRTAQSDLVQLNHNEKILYKMKVDTEDLTFVRVHGIIMIFTWVFIVSTGALISRYFKNSWTDRLICGSAAWFAVHRFLMSFAAVLTLLSFFFILIFHQGTWIRPGLTRAFAHSITGVLVISLAFFQPFIALFRCTSDSRYRYIFNYLHAFIGFSTFLLSIATLFLATYFDIFKDNRGRIILIIWIVWVVLVFTVFEIIQSYVRKKYGESSYSTLNASNTTIESIPENPTTPSMTLTRLSNQQEVTVEQKSKNILLAIHIFVAVTLSMILTTLII